MSFLAPLFLLGALAIAAPIIFHLIRRTTREKQPFSSLMFLQPTPPRLTKRSRLEHILLLTLRSLVFLLLAAGFARPFLPQSFSGESESESTRRVVVLLDTSASMRREGIWSQAADKAVEAIRSLKAQDQAAVFAFDREVQRLVTFEQWNATATGERTAVALQQVQQLRPGWHATQLDSALLAAVEALEETDARDPKRKPAGPREIVLITDLQEGSRLERLQAFEWPRGVSLTIETIKPRRPTNAGVQLVADASGGEPGDAAAARVRISNSTDAAKEQFAVGWATADGNGLVGDAVDVYVPPGQSRVIPLPKTPAGLPEEKLRLIGDEETFDNTAFIVPPRAEEVRVIYLGNDQPDDTKGSLFYLQSAFPPSLRQKITVQPHRLDALVPRTDFDQAALTVITGKPSEPQINDLKAALEHGRTALLTLPDTDTAHALAKLAGVGSVRCEEAIVVNYSLLGRVDFEHPIFKPFADPRYSDFAKIVFWKHRRVDTNDLPTAKALASFDDGSPALLQVAVGKGTLLVLTAGWHPADSQFALSTKFVPLIHSLMAFAGAAQDEARRLYVGDALRFRATDTQRVTVGKPDGSRVEITGGSFTGTDQPGIYTVSAGGETHRFAVNLDPHESRTAPMPLEELERLNVPLKSDAPPAQVTLAAKQQLLNAELENKQKLWRWLVVAALIVLLLETWLSGRLTRQPVAAS